MRTPVGVLWPNHLCPTSSRHLCHGHRGNANNGVLIQVMRLWHHGKVTTNNWRNLSNQNGESRLPFGVVRCPNQGYFPKYVKISTSAGRGSEILTSVIWPAFPAIHKSFIPSLIGIGMRWCDGAEKEPRYLLYLPIARSVPCHTRFLGFFPASSPPGHGLSSPCRASPCLGKSGRALLGTLRPSASRDIC